MEDTMTSEFNQWVRELEAMEDFPQFPTVPVIHPADEAFVDQWAQETAVLAAPDEA